MQQAQLTFRPAAPTLMVVGVVFILAGCGGGDSVSAQAPPFDGDGGPIPTLDDGGLAPDAAVDSPKVGSDSGVTPHDAGPPLLPPPPADSCITVVGASQRVTSQYWLTDTDNDIDVDLGASWSLSRGVASVIVAVTDSGIDLNHPDLVDALWENVAERDGIPGVDDDGNGFVDDVHGWDFASNDSDPTDSDGHGTGVAGIIGAQGLGAQGIAPGVRIMALRIGGNDSLAASFDYARRMGARIVTRSGGSYGTPLRTDNELRRAVERLEEAGVLLVTGSGNTVVPLAGTDGPVENQRVPCGYASFLSNVLCVGRVLRDGRHASGHSTSIVSLSAPGSEICSTAPRASVLPVRKATDSGYNSFSGNSFATPMATATAALMLSVNPGLSPSELIDRLESSAKLRGEYPGSSRTEGLLATEAAVRAARQ